MKRRSFFGAVAAMCVSPTLPAVEPAFTVTGTINSLREQWFFVGDETGRYKNLTFPHSMNVHVARGESLISTRQGR